VCGVCLCVCVMYVCVSVWDIETSKQDGLRPIQAVAPQKEKKYFSYEVETVSCGSLCSQGFHPRFSLLSESLTTAYQTAGDQN